MAHRQLRGKSWGSHPFLKPNAGMRHIIPRTSVNRFLILRENDLNEAVVHQSERPPVTVSPKLRGQASARGPSHRQRGNGRTRRNRDRVSLERSLRERIPERDNVLTPTDSGPSPKTNRRKSEIAARENDGPKQPKGKSEHAGSRLPYRPKWAWPRKRKEGTCREKNT